MEDKMIRMALSLALLLSLALFMASCSDDTSSDIGDSGTSIVTIQKPWDGTTRDGVVPVLVTATDPDEIGSVELYVAGELMATDDRAPFEFEWDMSSITDGSATSIYAIAVDAYNNRTESEVVTVTKGANAAPDVTITSPAAEVTILQDEALALAGEADDFENGALGEESFEWSTDLMGTIQLDDNGEFRGFTVGEHTLTLTAYDNDGVEGYASIKVTVEDNPANNNAYIAAGTYPIADPVFKQRTVVLSRPYWISKTEVSVKEFVEGFDQITGEKSGKRAIIGGFMEDRMEDINGKEVTYFPNLYAADPELDESNPNFDDLVYKDHPAIFIMYLEACDYCNAISTRDGLTPVYTYYDQRDNILEDAYNNIKRIRAVEIDRSANGWRMPTEAEWEVAARGGLMGKKFPWGDSTTLAKANSLSDPTLVNVFPLIDNRGPVPVKSYQPNGYGLYQMVGNVAEMCMDEYTTAPPSGYDPLGNTLDKLPEYVVKGGHWNNFGDKLQIGIRELTIPFNPSWKGGSAWSSSIGFRVVRNAD